ncbi:MAG: hypothetical protein IIA33_09075, partial [Planctomycetes bacterium]|nr:hypothetical protein [Planctomycetota bacterium]
MNAGRRGTDLICYDVGMKSSRDRYEHYLRKLNDSLRRTHGADGKLQGRRQRSFAKLFRAFLGLLCGHRRMLCLVLGALSISTVLALMPLMGTKIVLDNVLAGHPLPDWLPDWLPVPESRQMLLMAVTVIVGAL